MDLKITIKEFVEAKVQSKTPCALGEQADHHQKGNIHEMVCGMST